MPGKISSGFTKAMVFELNLAQRPGIFQGGKGILGESNSLYKGGEERKSMADLRNMKFLCT